MSALLWLATATQLVTGLLILAEARSAIHQILGVLLIGFAGIEFGLAAILVELKKTKGGKSSTSSSTATQSTQSGNPAPVYDQGHHRGIAFDMHTDHTVSAVISGQRYTWPSESAFRKWADQ